MKKDWNNPMIESLEIEETMNSVINEPLPDDVFGDIFPDGIGRDCSRVCS